MAPLAPSCRDFLFAVTVCPPEEGAQVYVTMLQATVAYYVLLV